MRHCQVKYLFVLFLLSSLLLKANENTGPVTVSGQNALSVLEHSRVIIDDGTTPLRQLIAHQRFVPWHTPYITIGMRPQTVWAAFALRNVTDRPINRVLVLSSPMLEHIALYSAGSLDTPRLNGRYHNLQDHHTLFYHFALTLPPKSTQQYYLEVRSDHAPVNFKATLEKPETFLHRDRKEATIAAMLIAAIAALGLYNLFIALFTRDRSYLFYSLYLFALIAQQATYLGLIQLHLPPWLNRLDIHAANLEGGIIILFSALFAMHFLKASTLPRIHKIYRFFIALTVAEILFVYLFRIPNMQLLSGIALAYVTFTLIAAVISYRNGNKQARLFILGFVLLFVSYMLFISDALGWTSIMHEHRNLLVWGTAIDALILSLAFADRYALLQQEKASTDRQLLKESHSREQIIQAEVVQKTAALNNALANKETLLQEVHHRVKNNLQVILSIVRLQKDGTQEPREREQFETLEYRIRAIAKSYDMLIPKDDLRKIEMRTYIDELLDDLLAMCVLPDRSIHLRRDIHAILPLKQSVYVGLIITELVNNACKYAFETRKGHISVTLRQDHRNYELIVEDNGKGYTLNPEDHTLGLKLIRTLVTYQLEGTMEHQTTHGTSTRIRFSI